MLDKDTIIEVMNRNNGTVGYTIPEINVRRQFAAKETKEIAYSELKALSYLPGGDKMLADYLVVKNEEAVKELLHGVEPEYYYTENDIIRLMTTGSLEEFLDCLDFSPAGVIDLIKDVAVELPLNDMAKRDAILEKIGFNVTNAIMVKNTKYDGETETKEEDNKPKRRVAAANEEKSSGRRTSLPKYNVVSK